MLTDAHILAMTDSHGKFSSSLNLMPRTYSAHGFHLAPLPLFEEVIARFCLTLKGEF